MTDLCAVTRGSPGLLIGLIDGSPVLSHPALAGAAIDVIASSGVGRSSAASAHATFIASMLVGRHPHALGLCSDCRLLAIVAVDDWVLDPTAPAIAVARRLALALDECRRRGVHVVQLSLELGFGTTYAARIVRDALAALAESGTPVVTSAGHASLVLTNDLLWVPGVIPVCAADEDGNVLADERYGGMLSLRGIAAPGTRVPGAVPPEGFGLRTGSSYAASFVTAALALQIAVNPALAPMDAASEMMRARSPALSAARPPHLDARRMSSDVPSRRGAFHGQCACT